MTVTELTDSDLLRIPGGEYAVLRKIRETVLAVSVAEPNSPPPRPPAQPRWPALTAPQDPWYRPPWDADTLFLPLYV